MGRTYSEAEIKSLLETALDQIRTLKQRRDTSERESIAVVGMGGRFPGVEHLQDLWPFLSSGQEGLCSIPRDRFQLESSECEIDNLLNDGPKKANLLSSVDEFDPAFFEISRREACVIDPQQRLLLEVVWEALEDAGIAPDSLRGSSTGIFIGMMSADYSRQFTNAESIDLHTAAGTIPSMAAGRLAYFFDTRGPAMSLDTACSSSLVAVHQAIRSLRDRECDLAIVGGVSLIYSPSIMAMIVKGGMLAQDGRSKTFSASADGYGRGEGCGVVVLRRSSDTKSMGERVHAVLRGSALRHDGRGNGLTVPNQGAQEDVISAALTDASVDPLEVGYVEAHGTGTPLGDPIEVHGLANAYCQGRSDESPLTIGAVKTNFGHMEGAAGIGSLIKSVLVVQQGKIPPSLHYDKPNPNIDWEGLPLRVADSLCVWPTQAAHRIAGVSSFGLSGTNCHVILEQVHDTEQLVSSDEAVATLFVLSAKSVDALTQLRVRIAHSLVNADANTLPDRESVAYTLSVGRQHFRHRWACVADTLEGFISALQGDNSDQVFEGLVQRSDLGAKSEAVDQLLLNTRTSEFPSAGLLAQLADYYCKGASIGFKQLFNQIDARQRIVSLPGYPFQRVHLALNKNQQISTDTETAKPSLSSLELEPVASDNPQLSVYRVIFSGEESFLQDHVVARQHVLPGVLYFEIASCVLKAEIGETSGKKLIVENTVWSQPFVFSEQQKSMTIQCKPQQNGRFELQFRSNENVLFCTQSICTSSASLALSSNVISLQEKKHSSNISLSKLGCYELFQQHGIHFGPGHQTLEEVRIIELGESREIIARLALPSAMAKTASLYRVHPSMLDGVLQAAIGLYYDDPDNETWLPFALDELQFYGHFKSQAIVWIHNVRPTSNTQGLIFDAKVFDQEWEPVAKLSGLMVGRAATDQPSTCLFYRQLAEHAVEHTNAENLQIPVLTIAIGDPDWTIQVNNAFECAFADNDQLWSFMTVNPPTQSVTAAYRDAVNRVLDRIRTEWAKTGRGATMVQLLVADSTRSPLMSGLAGLLKSAQIEYPGRMAQILSCQDLLPQDLPSLLRAAAMSGESELFAEQSTVRRPRWKELPRQSAGTTNVRRRGCYLVSGGLGSIGLAMSRSLLEKEPDCSIVLMARNSPSKDAEEELLRLKAQGAHIEFFQGDVSDRDDVKSLFNKLRDERIRLNGILHIAGKTGDSLLMNTDPLSSAEVLSPKVDGLVLLDEHSKSMALEYFVCFSSITSVLGNVGQAVYAGANGFMDRYMEYRNYLANLGLRRGKSVSINWPFWEEGGMHISESTRDEMTRKGLRPLSTASAFEALNRCLSSDESNIMVLHGDSERISDLVDQLDKKPVLVPENKPYVNDVSSSAILVKDLPVTLAPPGTSQDFERVQKRVFNAISKTIKIDKSEIDEDATFLEYGFDSMTLTELSMAIQKEFEVEIAPTLFFELPNIESLVHWVANAQPRA